VNSIWVLLGFWGGGGGGFLVFGGGSLGGGGGLRSFLIGLGVGGGGCVFLEDSLKEACFSTPGKIGGGANISSMEKNILKKEQTKTAP